MAVSLCGCTLVILQLSPPLSTIPTLSLSALITLPPRAFSHPARGDGRPREWERPRRLTERPHVGGGRHGTAVAFTRRPRLLCLHSRTPIELLLMYARCARSHLRPMSTGGDVRAGQQRERAARDLREGTLSWIPRPRTAPHLALQLISLRTEPAHARFALAVRRPWTSKAC